MVVLSFVAALALAANVGTVVAANAATRTWLERLQPKPTAVSTPTARPRPTATPTPTTPARTAQPTQTTGAVEVTDDVERGVVLVSGQTSAESVAGTGMILTADGYVLTNYHVVRSTVALTVTVAATGRRYPATLAGRDATKDVALLKIEASGLQPVAIDRDEVRLADVVVVAGNANGQGYVTANRGNVQAMGRSIQVRGSSVNDPPETLKGLIETNAAAWPGDSGGPMFDGEHEVLGMTTAGSSGSESTRQVYAVPIAAALSVVEQIKDDDESGSVVIGPKAYLGITTQTDDASAVVIMEVSPGTPASEAGLQKGDTLLSVDGQKVTTRVELSTVLDGIEPGTSVELEWRTADGATRTASVALAASPLN